MTNEQKIDMGNRIKEARNEAKLTQVELAKIVKEASSINVTQSMIGQYERGLYTPKLEMIAYIANALEKPIEYFLPLVEYDTPEEYDKAMEKLRKQPGEEIAITHYANGSQTIETVYHANKKREINGMLDTLNDAGIDEAHRQVSVLTEVPKYRK